METSIHHNISLPCSRLVLRPRFRGIVLVTSLWSVWIRLFARTHRHTWEVWVWHTTNQNRSRPEVFRQSPITFPLPAKWNSFAYCNHTNLTNQAVRVWLKNVHGYRARDSDNRGSVIPKHMEYTCVWAAAKSDNAQQKTDRLRRWCMLVPVVRMNERFGHSCPSL